MPATPRTSDPRLRSGAGVARPVTPPAPALRDPDASPSNGPYAVTAEAFWSGARDDQAPTPPNRAGFTVRLRESDALIGFIGVQGIDYTHRLEATASEMIDPGGRGGGYGSDARRLRFDPAFNALGLYRTQS